MGIMTPRKEKDKLVEERETGQNEDDSDEQKKFCADCKTTKTPLWRGGPSGPKSLCNACGIRYRKRRVTFHAIPLTRSSGRKRDRRHIHYHGGKGVVINSSTNSNSGSSSNSVAGSSSNNNGKEWSDSLRMRLMIVGNGYVLKTSFVKKQRCQRRRKFFSAEEEQAAVSLMALSCGTVSA